MKRLSQGQSGDATEIKQRGLSFAFRIGLNVINKWQRFRYFHFDLHAGGGFNHQAKCIGSPLTFIAETRVAGCDRYFAGFCDCERERVKELSEYQAMQDERCTIFHGDNRELLSMVPDIVRHYRENPRYAIGSILSDPNGADVPLDAIVDVAATCPRLDIVFHWNSTITKRLRYGIKPAQITLDDIPRLVPKQHWLIREPIGPHQFTMLIGRNYRYRDWPAMGFYHLDSEKGQAVLKRCSLSAKDLEAEDDDDQGGLF